MAARSIGRGLPLEYSGRAYLMPDSEQTREALAAYAHEAWSGWMTYMLGKCEPQPDGTAIMPAWAVERWTRQANTAYADLPEDEKASDRDEADRMLRIVSATAAEQL